MMRNLILLPLLCLALVAQAQYSEPFSTANKGYRIDFIDDFTAVNWTMTPWSQSLGERDAADYFNTTAVGVLECIDLDQEVCWESPLINTTAANPVSIEMDLTWVGFDVDVAGGGCLGDYIKVMYSVNGGAYTMIPNVKGGNACATVAYLFSGPAGPHNDNVHINHTGIAGGSTLKIRVCVFTNANAEVVTIDNVSVPQAGVTVGCAAPTLSTVITQVGCSNPNSGAIDLTASAGNPPYTYSWTGGATTQDLTNKPTGTYTVTVTDAASCSATISAVITNAPALSLTTQVLDASCSGNFDGEISLDVSGGVPGYTYDWSNDGPETPDNDPQDLVNLGTGTYTVTVTDASGCSSTKSATVGVLPSGAYLEQFNIANKGYLPNFVDDFSGVAWTMSGWLPQPPALFGRDVDDFFRTSGGVLVGEDFDQEICWTSPLVDLNGGTQFSVNLAWAGFDVQVDEYINVNYSIDGGSFITLPNIVGGGAGTIQYASGLDQSGSVLASKTGLSGTTIQIQVCGSFNSNNESMTIDNVSIPGSNNYCPAPEPSLSPTNVTCNGAANGTITTTVVNGSAPYTYAWSDGPVTTQNRTGLGPGTYTVTVTDANMATGTASTMISQPAAILLSTTQVNVLCNGASTGSIDLSVSGGTGGYTYNWGGGVTTQDRSSLPAGTYTVTVTDANSCTKTISTTTTEPAAISITAILTHPTNCNAADGIIDLNVSNGLSPYSYDWSNDGPETPDNDLQDLSNVVEGTYTVTVTDANSCTKTSSFTLDYLDIIPPSITCPGNVTINANASCQAALGSYAATSVSDNCNPAPTVTQSPTASTILTGHNTTQTVTLTANDGNNTANCTLTVTLKDVTPPNIVCPANATVNANASCQGTLGSYAATSLSDNCNPSPVVTQSPASSTVLTGHNSTQLVTLTANDGNGNTSTCSLTVTLKDVTPPNIVCPANATVNANASCQGTVGSYSATSLSDNCNPSPVATQSPASSTILTGHNSTQLVTLTANDGNGNTSTCSLTVTLKDVTPPSISCPANATVNANASCQGTVGSYVATSLSDNCNPSPVATQSPASSTVLTGHNSTQLVTLTANDGNGNTNTCTLTVTLKDVTPPNIVCPANATVNANASCQGTVGSYSATSLSDNCNPSPVATQSPASSTVLTGHNSTQLVTLTANDGNGNTSTCTLTVTLKDVTPPSISCPANATVNANASCQGTVGSYSATSLSDNCNPSPVATQSPASSTVLTGHNSTQLVTLTANDGNGNTSTCTLTVTLKDVTPPNIVCPANATVNVNASCQGTVGSYAATSLSDNCNPSPVVTQSPASSTLMTGHNSTQLVTLTANDGNGNTSTCTLTVTLKDVTPPNLVCPANATVNANASCQGTVGSYSATSLSDNCNPSPVATQSPASSTLLTGHNSTQLVTLTANDGNGNTSTCSLTVTLKDVTPPSISCPANATVNANASCQGTVGSYAATSLSDNCNPSPVVIQSPASSTVLTGHNSTQLVTLTANDGNGNTSTCTLTVTLKDVTPPSISCPANATVNANASCQGTVGSYSATSLSDNCNPSPAVTQSPASSTVLTGHNSSQLVTLTANDGNGNTANCTLTVTLKDVTPPSISCPANATVNANASCQGTVGSYVATSLSDNCNPSPTVTQSPASSTVLTGHNSTQLVTLTANDGNGNTSTCSLTVTLKDVTPPNITCPGNITLNVNASCSATVGSYLPTNLVDNCNPTPTASQSPLPGTVLSGANSVTTVFLTGSDGNGNTQNCTFTITLKDVTPPTVVCKPFTANLGANGMVTITPANVYQSGADNCGTVNLQSVAPSSFTCNNIGANQVILTVNDGNGNTAACSATVTVADVTVPVAKCKDITANLGINGTVTVAPSLVNNGTTDNCSFTLTLTPNTFNCSNVGIINTVVLRATDAGGNSATCTAKVTVKDLVAPTAKCKNPTIFLDALGQATLSASQVNNGSTDACGIATMSINDTQFNCSELAGSPWPVTLSLSDVNGNSSSCLAYVTVKDAIAPTAVCEDVTVALGLNGYAAVYCSDLTPNSTDNCAVWSCSPNAKVYTAANLGANNLTVTVKDWSNNGSTCVSVVTVVPYGSNNSFQQGGGGKGYELLGSHELLLFPNPTSGDAEMVFQLPMDQSFVCRIFDTSGRMVYSHEDRGLQGENRMPLRLEGLAPGLYVVDFQSEDWKVQKRLVVQE